MGRFWRASTVGGVRLPIAPGCKHPASVMPRHHRVPAPHLSSREARQGAPSCRASMHQHKGCAQRRPPQDGTAGCQCTSTKAEHNDIPRSRGEVGAPPHLRGRATPRLLFPPVACSSHRSAAALLPQCLCQSRQSATTSTFCDEGPHPPLTWQSPAPF